MAARVLDGQALARTIQEEIAPDVAAFTAQHGRPPGLGIVLVGEDPASEVYVRGKVKAGTGIGFRLRGLAYRGAASIHRMLPTM